MNIDNLIPVSEWTLENWDDGYYRFVNHDAKLATSGWLMKESAHKNADMHRIDNGTITIMHARYLQHYPTKASV